MMLTAFTQKTWLLTSSGLNHPPANLLYFQSPFILTAFCTCLSFFNILALSFKSSLWADSLKSTDATRREFPQAPPIHPHWSTPVQQPVLPLLHCMNDRSASPRPTSSLMHRTCHLTPYQRDSSSNSPIFFALSVFSLLCNDSHQHQKDVSLWWGEFLFVIFPSLSYAPLLSSHL